MLTVPIRSVAHLGFIDLLTTKGRGVEGLTMNSFQTEEGTRGDEAMAAEAVCPTNTGQYDVLSQIPWMSRAEEFHGDTDAGLRKPTDSGPTT